MTSVFRTTRTLFESVFAPKNRFFFFFFVCYFFPKPLRNPGSTNKTQRFRRTRHAHKFIGFYCRNVYGFSEKNARTWIVKTSGKTRTRTLCARIPTGCLCVYVNNSIGGVCLVFARTSVFAAQKYTTYEKWPVTPVWRQARRDCPGGGVFVISIITRIRVSRACVISPYDNDTGGGDAFIGNENIRGHKAHVLSHSGEFFKKKRNDRAQQSRRYLQSRNLF